MAMEASDVREKPPVVTGIAVHTDEPWVAVAGDDHLVSVWNADTGQRILVLPGPKDWVRTVQFSPRGNVLAAGADGGVIYLWSLPDGILLGQIPVTPARAVYAVAFEPGGKRLFAVGYGEDLYVIDMASQTVVRRLACPAADMRAVAHAPQGSLLAAAGRDGVIRIWDLETYQVVTDVAEHKRRVRGLQFSPSGDVLASADEGGEIRVWRVGEWNDPLKLSVAPVPVFSLCFCGPNTLATGGSDNLIRIWDLAEAGEIARVPHHTGTISAVAYRASAGELLAGSFDTTVSVWRMAETPQTTALIESSLPRK
jgi:WD40 repeat protein